MMIVMREIEKEDIMRRRRSMDVMKYINLMIVERVIERVWIP